MPYLAEFNVFLRGRTVCCLDDWLAFSQQKGETDDDYVSTPGREASLERRSKPTHRLFCAKEIRAMWTLFVTHLAQLRDREAPLVSAAKIDSAELGLLLIIQCARSGGIAEHGKRNDKLHNNAIATEKAPTPRVITVLPSPRRPSDDKLTSAVVDSFVSSCMSGFVRVAGRALGNESFVNRRDLQRLDVLFKVDDSWFAANDRLPVVEVVTVFSQHVVFRTPYPMTPEQVGALNIGTKSEAIFSLSSRKRETFIVDQPMLDVVGETFGLPIRQLPLLLQSLENCTVYVLGAVGSVRILDCRHCRVVLCAVAGAVSIINSVCLDLSVAARAVKVENTYDSTLRVYSPCEPIIVGDSRSLTLGPFAVCYSKLMEVMRQARLPYNASHVCSWQTPEVVATRKQSTAADEVYQHLKPDAFWLETVPEKTTNVERPEILLPEVYCKEIKLKRRRVLENLERVRALPAHAWQETFFEWSAPFWREVEDLSRKHA